MMTIWLPIVIALVITLVKVLVNGKEYRDALLFTVIAVLISALLSLLIDFIIAFTSDTTFIFTLTALIPYFVFAIVGSVIVPIAIWLSKLKLN
ncbi:Uncharacterised protein [uncultured archaeon]|nr:Uncharacterised protein [uncultured archaeon]